MAGQAGIRPPHAGGFDDADPPDIDAQLGREVAATGIGRSSVHGVDPCRDVTADVSGKGDVTAAVAVPRHTSDQERRALQALADVMQGDARA